MSLEKTKESWKEVDIQLEDSHSTGSNFSAFLHIVCATAGAGVLGLSSATEQGGWCSIILLIVMAGVAQYNGQLIIKCLYHNKGNRLDGYPEVANASFGKWFKLLTQILAYGTCFSSVLIYIILTGGNFATVIHNLTEASRDEYKAMTRWYILGAGVVISLLFCFVKTLKEVTIMSIFGVVTTFFTIIVSTVLCGISLKENGVKGDNPWPSKILALGSSMATFAFAYGGSVVFPHVEGIMKDKSKWSKMLLLSMVIMTIFYLIMACAGFAAFGGDLGGKKITDAINDSRLNTSPAIMYTNKVSIVLITLHVLFASPIYLCTVCLDFEKSFNITVQNLGVKKEFIYRVGFRFLVILLLTLISYALPTFGPVLELIGALVVSPVVFIIPIVCHLKLFGAKGRPIWQYFLFAMIFTIGILCASIGSYNSIMKIIDKFF